MSKINQLISEIKTLADDLKLQVSAIDDQIDDAQRRRSSLTGAAVSREDFIQYVKLDIKRQAERFKRSLITDLERAPKQYPTLDRGIRLNYLTHDHTLTMSLTDPAFFFYFGDLVAERISRAIDEDMDWPNGIMPVSERREIVANIDAEIADLSKRRQALSVQLIEAGLAG